MKPLQEWIREQLVDDEMLWKDAWGAQLRFLRDRLAPVVKGTASVISTHRSKSIALPVVMFERPDLAVIVRGNFYNWKLSVVSKEPVLVDLSGLCHTTPPIEPDYTGDELDPGYFEGFPASLIYPYYEPSDKKTFSAELTTDHELWTAVFLIVRACGGIPPCRWTTRASHAAEMAAAAEAREARSAPGAAEGNR